MGFGLLSIASGLIVGLAIYLHSIVLNQYQYGNFNYINTNDVVLHDLITNNPNINIKEINININNSYIIHSWLFLPSIPSNNLSIVVLSHGLGSQKDMGLSNYAISFVNEGYASLLIDYRYFGGSYDINSNNTLRNYINPWNHVKDIKLVVEYISSGQLDDRINSQSIVLWGSSFAGGHSLVVANELQHKLKGIISQVPHLSGKAASKRGIIDRGVFGSIKVAVLVISDYILSELLGYEPVYIKVAGTTNDTAYMMLSQESLDLYFSKHPKIYLGSWKNLAPARTLAVMSLYNPIDYASNITIPVLFIGAYHDTLCPIEFIQLASQLVEKSELVLVDGSHFDIYQGKGFEKATNAMVAFLNKILH